jgi:hypothetical protein
MPYDLENALPTFVRAMSKTFGDLIRDKVEVYVDDIVVKTKRGSVTPGFRRQTECEPCTCQDQLFTYTAVT